MTTTMPKRNHAPTQSRHEQDQPQYRRMVERLDSFDAGDLDLGRLVSELGTLFAALERKPDREWADDYAALCAELETIASMALYRADSRTRRTAAPASSEEEIERARDIAGSLKRIVLAKVKPWRGP
jgi:hypothetical protein